MTASQWSRVKYVLALSKKKVLLIAAKRMCLEIISRIAPCCASSFIPRPSLPGQSFFKRFSLSPVASAKGPKSSAFRTALADHLSSWLQSTSSSTANSSSLINPAMIQPWTFCFNHWKKKKQDYNQQGKIILITHQLNNVETTHASEISKSWQPCASMKAGDSSTFLLLSKMWTQYFFCTSSGSAWDSFTAAVIAWRTDVESDRFPK